MTLIHFQRGSTLLVSLIMLVLMTLIAISAMSSTTINLQMVGNAQFREEATAAGQRAIEVVLSKTNFLFTPPSNQSIDINQDGTADYLVSFVPAPQCLSYRAVNFGDEGVPSTCAADATLGAVCYWTVWDITANVSDIRTGANIVIHQGIRTVAGLKSVAQFCH